MPLSVVGVEYTYPGSAHRALADVHLDFDEGVTGLVGVNGAGKSTLLRILARAMRPRDGRVTWNGTDIHRSRRKAIAGRIGYVPQDFRLPRGSRVLDSMLYLGWLKGVGAGAGRRRAVTLLDALGLADLAGSEVATLSGGMVRRLALAQALMSTPEVLILDEPTTGLDPEQRVIVRELVADGDLRAPVTIVSSHVMEDVEALADDLVLIEEGRVAFAGSLLDFLTGPDGSVRDPETAFLHRIVRARR